LALAGDSTMTMFIGDMSMARAISASLEGISRVLPLHYGENGV
jgi:hypothetical protein